MFKIYCYAFRYIRKCICSCINLLSFIICLFYLKGLGRSGAESAGSSRNSNLTPIEDQIDSMATVVDGQYTPLNGRMEAEDNGKKRNLLGDTQGDIVELSQMITHPGMRKAESMEVLNLSIHQVCTKITTFSQLPCFSVKNVTHSTDITMLKFLLVDNCNHVMHMKLYNRQKAVSKFKEKQNRE